MKKPTAREFQYDKPFCLIMGDSCLDCFEQKGEKYNPMNCSNCIIAFEHKNRNVMLKSMKGGNVKNG